jgi:N-acetylglucosamine-6-phosphate deacetylase
MPTRITGPAVVVIDGGRIVAIEPTSEPVPDLTLAPGFVDLQVNGIGSIDVAHAKGDDWNVLDRALLAQGVTTWCPTLVTAPLDSYAAPLDRIAAAAARDDGEVRPAIAGAHLEGPFLGGAPGAHPVDLIRPPDREWLAGLPSIVKVVTLAPESEGVIDCIESLVATGVLVSLGHSTASYAQALDATAAGARLVTHCFNGMAPLHHREPGLVGAALTDDRLAVSVIADLVHVHAAAIAIAFRAKGAGQVVLVTDAVAWDRGTVGDAVRVTFDGTAPRLADGTLAGSALTMDKAVRNVVEHCGVSLLDAVHAAAATPARLLGLDDRGEILPGRRADLAALGPDLTVQATWVGGRAAEQLGAAPPIGTPVTSFRVRPTEQK